MPKIQVSMTDSEGWKPLPKGTYNFMIDSSTQTVSSNSNPQLKLMCHVIHHPQHESKKSTLFLPMVPRAAWRVREILDATGIEAEEVELPKGSKQDEEGSDIKYELSFDTEDLVGASFTADVTIEMYNGKEQNRFNEIRPFELPKAGAQQQRAQSTQGAAAPATTTQGSGEVAAAPAAGAEPIRRRRVVQAS
jgi:hypothetical protein